MMKRDKKNILILALTLVVVILLGALIYVFFVTPALNGLIKCYPHTGKQFRLCGTSGK